MDGQHYSLILNSGFWLQVQASPPLPASPTPLPAQSPNVQVVKRIQGHFSGTSLPALVAAHKICHTYCQLESLF